MKSDYYTIKKEHIRRFGTDVADYGPTIFKDLYSEKSHFILELLQNAEDALARRGDSTASSTVRFDLGKDHLRVTHFGAPFTEQDVRSICAIAKSTKQEITDIGRFGIGFKSVYGYTDRPEVHSGPEAFAIEHFVWPEATDPIDRDPESTVFLLPFRESDESSYKEVLTGLDKLDPNVLLFLRQIDGIVWTDESGREESYLRSQERVTDRVRRATLTGADPAFETQEYMIFSRPVERSDGKDAGFVEIAFRLSEDGKSVRPVNKSNLVAFFPTVVPTGLGFLVQGPYRTTPTRETVPPDNDWNQYLVLETAKVLVEVLRWFRDHNLLDPELLSCLPLEMDDNDRFGPLFDATRKALASEVLLPRADGGYIAGNQALLARGKGIRDLLDPDRMAQVFPGKQAWISGRITTDRTPVLHSYLRNALAVEQIRPDSMVRKLERSFLEAQPDEWIVRLYEYLNDRRDGTYSKIWWSDTFLLRLTDGSHVTSQESDVFLPGDFETSYRTVKKEVCESQGARHFLEYLGLRKVDHIDDIIENVLPVYQEPLEVTEATVKAYQGHMKRILDVYDNANSEQSCRLLKRLSKTKIVLALDYQKTRSFQAPDEVYLPTDTLTSIFNTIDGIYFLDSILFSDENKSLTRLFEKCGVSRGLRPVLSKNRVSLERAESLRQELYNRDQSNTWANHSNKNADCVIDWEVKGLKEAIECLPDRSTKDQEAFGIALWSEIRLGKGESVQSSSGWNPYEGRWVSPKRWFSATNTYSIQEPFLDSTDLLHGKYVWSYYRKPFFIEFDSLLVERLKNMSWVVDKRSGTLGRPSEVVFDSLGWEDDPELRELLGFKAPEPDLNMDQFDEGHLIDRLADMNGIESSEVVEGLVLVKKIQGTDVSFSDIAEYVEERQISLDKKQSTRTRTSVSRTSPDKTTPYREALAERMSFDNPESASKPVYLPGGGPLTEDSAEADTARSAASGKSGSRRSRTTVSFVKDREARKLERKFREMAGGDYEGRCQICGTTFLRPDGESSRFIAHIVASSDHELSNHYGNLLSLCGLHQALIRWGQWSAIDTNGAQVDNLLAAASEQVDDSGITYIGVRVRFTGLYPGWQPDSEDREEVIRFSKPHWTYHRKLFESEEK